MSIITIIDKIETLSKKQETFFTEEEKNLVNFHTNSIGPGEFAIKKHIGIEFKSSLKSYDLPDGEIKFCLTRLSTGKKSLSKFSLNKDGRLIANKIKLYLMFSLLKDKQYSSFDDVINNEKICDLLSPELSLSSISKFDINTQSIIFDLVLLTNVLTEQKLQNIYYCIDTCFLKINRKNWNSAFKFSGISRNTLTYRLSNCWVDNQLSNKLSRSNSDGQETILEDDATCNS